MGRPFIARLASEMAMNLAPNGSNASRMQGVAIIG